MPRQGPEFRKDRWYWVRYKFGPTLTPGKPHEIREGRVTFWSLPWVDRIVPEKGDEIEVVAEIPFPKERHEV